MVRSMLEGELYEKLLAIRHEQLEFSNNDTEVPLAYFERTLDVQNFAKKVMAQLPLTKETVALLRRVTLTDIITSKFMLKLRKITRSVGEAAERDMQSAMAKLSLYDIGELDKRGTSIDNNCPASEQPYKVSETQVGGTDTERSKDMGLRQMHEWSLNHLYDPYPSLKMKKIFANGTLMTEEQVGAWFMRLRRKIGWTKIVKEHFARDRAFAIDSARLVLFEGKKAGGQVSKVVYDAFIAMKAKAEGILSSSNPNEIEEHIDHLIEEVTAQRRKPALGSKNPVLSSPVRQVSNAMDKCPLLADEATTTKGIKRTMEESVRARPTTRSRKCERFVNILSS